MSQYSQLEYDNAVSSAGWGGFAIGAALFSVVFGGLALFVTDNLRGDISELEIINDRLEDAKYLLLDELGEDASIVYKFNQDGQVINVEVPDVRALLDQEMDDFEYIGPKLIRKPEGR